MIYKKSCGVIVYYFHMDMLFVTVKYMSEGHALLPKGYMQEGETEAQTAIRAIREETGLEVCINDVFRHEVTYSPEPGVQETVVFFLAAEDKARMVGPRKDTTVELRNMGIEYAINAMIYDSEKDVLYHAGSYLAWRYYHMTWAEGRDPATPRLLYREHAVDIHSHILPKIDDGAQSLEEARDMALMDREEGMDVVFATPHYGIENGFAPKSSRIKKKLTELNEQIYWVQGECPYPLVYPGTEWYCSDDIVERIMNKEAFPLGESNWYMVEFLEWGNVTEPADVMIYRLAKMRMAGIRTILAHPERYRAIQQDWEVAKRICDLGVLLQVNAYDLCLNSKLSTRNLAQWLAQEHLISFIGSDMHGTREGSRKPRMKEGVNWLYENVDEDYANDIVRRNAERYLKVNKLPILKD